MARQTKRASRPTSGVVVSLSDTTEGALQVVMDDVRRSGAGRWSLVGHFTSREFDSRTFRTLKIPAGVSRLIGENLILRLLAQDTRARAQETAREFRGAWVVFNELPWWVSKLPSTARRVFRFCKGRPYRVAEVASDGLLVLDVSQDVDAKFGGFMNDLRLEPEWVTRVRPPAKNKARPRRTVRG